MMEFIAFTDQEKKPTSKSPTKSVEDFLTKKLGALIEKESRIFNFLNIFWSKQQSDSFESS